MGKGAAIISAKKFVKGDVVIIQDADLEYDPRDYIKILKVISEENEIAVYGSRVLGKKDIHQKVLFQKLEFFLIIF